MVTILDQHCNITDATKCTYLQPAPNASQKQLTSFRTIVPDPSRPLKTTPPTRLLPSRTPSKVPSHRHHTNCLVTTNSKQLLNSATSSPNWSTNNPPHQRNLQKRVSHLQRCTCHLQGCPTLPSHRITRTTTDHISLNPTTIFQTRQPLRDTTSAHATPSQLQS